MGKSIDQLEQSFANKSAQYWASMRTNINLMGRSETVDQLKIEQLESELSDILESGILTYPSTLNQLKITPDMSLVQRKDQFGLRTLPLDHTKEEQKFLDNMAFKADTMRKSNWAWRIANEAEEKQSLGWHPFFITLTVDPNKHDPKELWTKTNAFRKYIRKLVNIVCKELGEQPAHKKPYRAESNYVTYAGVLEHGKSREHHHMHILVWMRAIPTSWRICPNKRIKNPEQRIHRECKPMRALWEYSSPQLSPALYFRSLGDIYELKYKFELPIDKKTGKAIKVGPPRSTGHYITKYLSKEHREWHHRMKATRNLGMNKLTTFLNNQKMEIVEALTWRPENSKLNLSLMKIHSIPQGLLRSEAKRRLYLLRFRARQLDLKMLLTQNYATFTAMLSSVRSGDRPDRMDSHQFYDWVGKHLPVSTGYCREKLTAAHIKIAASNISPPRSPIMHHTKIGANDIGHS